MKNFIETVFSKHYFFTSHYKITNFPIPQLTHTVTIDDYFRILNAIVHLIHFYQIIVVG